MMRWILLCRRIKSWNDIVLWIIEFLMREISEFRPHLRGFIWASTLHHFPVQKFYGHHSNFLLSLQRKLDLFSRSLNVVPVLTHFPPKCVLANFFNHEWGFRIWAGLRAALIFSTSAGFVQAGDGALCLGGGAVIQSHQEAVPFGG